MIVLRSLRCSLVFVIGLWFTVAGCRALADGAPLYPKGQRALLEYSIAIEGDFEHRPGHRDEFYKWSTRRLLEAKVEMQAGEPRKESRVFPQDAQNAAAMQNPDADYRNLAAQMEDCPKGDTNCQMQLAMKMMGSDYMQQQAQASEAMERIPKRYQDWTAVQGGKLEAKATYDDHWEEVYYTGGREYHECHLVIPGTPSDIGRKYIEGAARAFMVEIDAQTGQQRAVLPATGDFPGQRGCLDGMGSNKANMEKHEQDEYVHFFPKANVAAGLEGNAPGSEPAVISSGEQTVEGKVEHIGGTSLMAERVAPVRVTVRWKLTRK